MLRVLIPSYGRLASPKVSASPLIWTIVIALAGAFSLASHTAGASPMFAKTSDASPPSMDDLFRKLGAVYGVEWQLLKSIAVLANDMRLTSIDNHGDARAKPRMLLTRPPADTSDLFIQLKQMHWNATGAQFCLLPKCANRQTRGVAGPTMIPSELGKLHFIRNTRRWNHVQP